MIPAKLLLLVLIVAALVGQDPGEEEKKIRDKQAEISAFLKTAKADKDLRLALDELRSLADRAYAIDRYDLSEKLLTQAEGIARALKNVTLVGSIQAALKKTREVHRDFDAILKAYGAGTPGQASPEDSLKIGKFLCFVKGNWELGLKSLAEGKDEALKDLATKDQAGADGADAQLALGDAWGAAAKKYPSANERALHWYKKAWPSLKGITRERIRGKFREIVLRTSSKEIKKLPEQWIFWTRDGGQLGEVSQMVLEDGVSPSGGRSLRVSPGAWIVTSKRFPLKPGAQYTVSFWIMTDSVPSLEASAFFVQISGAKAGQTAEIGFDVALDQPWWEKMTKTFTAPDWATSGGFNMRIGFKDGRFWLDDISVVAVDDPVDLMENGSFERMR